MKLLKSQTGMTLIEIMIAVSILSVIMVSVMMLGKNMDKSAKNAEKRGDIESYSREIGQLLADKDSCSATVFGASAGTGAANRTYVTSLKSIDVNGNIIANPRLRVNAINSGATNNQVVINGMYLENTGDLGNGANYKLVVTFVKNPKAAGGNVNSQANTLGQNYVKREFPILVDNCGRVVEKTNAAGGTPSCLNPVGGVVNITSNAAPNDDDKLWKLQICRACGTRTRAKGCI